MNHHPLERRLGEGWGNLKQPAKLSDVAERQGKIG